MWWNKNDTKITYASYMVNETEVLVGPKLSTEARGCSQEFFDSVKAWLSVTETYVEYPISANVRWFPWKEGMEPFPDHVLFGSLKMLNHWVNELKLPRIYIHCDLGTHRAPSVFGAFLHAYYRDTQQDIVDKRIIFNPTHSTLIGSDGRIYGDPIEAFGHKMERTELLLPEIITEMLKDPKADLQTAVRQAFRNRPLSIYTFEEKLEYDRKQEKINYQKRLREWLNTQGVKVDVNASADRTNFFNTETPMGRVSVITDDFAPDMNFVIKEFGQGYFTHEISEDTFTDEDEIKEISRVQEGEFLLIYVKGKKGQVI